MVFDQTRQPCGPRFWRSAARSGERDGHRMTARQSSENGNRRQSTPPGSRAQSGVGFPASRHRSRIWWIPRPLSSISPARKKAWATRGFCGSIPPGGGHIPIDRELGRIPDRDAIMVHADLGGGRPGVVAMDDGVDDRLSHGLPWHGEGLGAPDVFPGHQSQRVFRAEQARFRKAPSRSRSLSITSSSESSSASGGDRSAWAHRRRKPIERPAVELAQLDPRQGGVVPRPAVRHWSGSTGSITSQRPFLVGPTWRIRPALRSLAR